MRTNETKKNRLAGLAIMIIAVFIAFTVTIIIEHERAKATVTVSKNPGAIFEAKAKSRHLDTESAKELFDKDGYLLAFETSDDEKTKILERVNKNPLLAKALEYAKEKEVLIIFWSPPYDLHFLIRNGYVKIPIKATDEKIINFLLGSSPKDKTGQ